MKKFNILLIIFLVTTISCQEDLLDKQPLDRFSESNVWTSVDLAGAFINNIYTDALGLYYGETSDDWTDNVMLSDFGLTTNSMFGSSPHFFVQAGVFTSERDLGWNKFAAIRKCNLAIEKLTDNENIAASSRVLMIAEAKMMRAMIYYWMARRFGGLMIVDKVLTPGDDFLLSRSTEQQTYDFIISDIEQAAEDLPATAVPHGRLSKNAAYAFLTKVALQIGDYDKVIEAADKVEEGSATLDDYFNVSKGFTQILNSPEVLLSYARDSKYNSMTQTLHQRLLPGLNAGVLAPGAQPTLNDNFTGWLQLYPTQELVDAYLFAEGGEAVQKKGVEFIGEPAKLMWKDRDARFDLSIVHDSSMFFHSMVTTRKGGNMHRASRPDAPGQSPFSGYVFRKFVFENETPDNSIPMNYALPLLRLGEVYLNKAEAYYRKGNLPLAIEYMNKTRTRHGELPALSSGVSEDEFFNFYKLERQVELLFENDRYWSLIRWAKEDNASSIPELEGVLHAIDIEADGTVANVIQWPHIAYSMIFEYPKRLYFPVPITEIRNNPKLTQNPGW